MKRKTVPTTKIEACCSFLTAVLLAACGSPTNVKLAATDEPAKDSSSKSSGANSKDDSATSGAESNSESASDIFGALLRFSDENTINILPESETSVTMPGCTQEMASGSGIGVAVIPGVALSGISFKIDGCPVKQGKETKYLYSEFFMLGKYSSKSEVTLEIVPSVENKDLPLKALRRTLKLKPCAVAATTPSALPSGSGPAVTATPKPTPTPIPASAIPPLDPAVEAVKPCPDYVCMEIVDHVCTSWKLQGAAPGRGIIGKCLKNEKGSCAM